MAKYRMESKKHKPFLTPKNYKRYSYDHYYVFGDKGKKIYKFTIDGEGGYEEIYDASGNYEGEQD